MAATALGGALMRKIVPMPGVPEESSVAPWARRNSTIASGDSPGKASTLSSTGSLLAALTLCVSAGAIL